MAMQAMAAMESAAILYGALTQPREKKMSEVMSSVATVMPEIGFEELPTSPVRRELTVTKRKPSTRISSEPRMLIFSEGTSAQMTTSASDPTPTTQSGMSRSVRGICTRAPPTPPDRLFIPRIAPPTMVGSDLNSEMMPPAATAPAPMYRMYWCQTSSGVMSWMSLVAG